MCAVADPGGAGIFEAPDYILRPKLRIFQADQSCPPWPNPGSVPGVLNKRNQEIALYVDIEWENPQSAAADTKPDLFNL